MTDERHDEIAARLRAEAGARAPERLRADVMLRVRAEPRPRRLRPPRRRGWRPLGAVAAVACLLAALVVGLSHGASSGPEASLTSAGGAAGGATAAPERLGALTEKHAGGAASPAGVHGTTTYRRPSLEPARAIQFQAESLPPRLRQALESLLLTRGRGAH